MKTSTGNIGARGRAIVIALLSVAFCFGYTAAAFAYPNPPATNAPFSSYSCNACHSSTSIGDTSTWDGRAPHSNYSTTTTKCSLCHSVHNAPAGGAILLPKATVTATCLYCHDGTQSGIGPYHTIVAHSGTVVAEHSMDTNVIPGGSSDLASNLSCSSCHAVHGANTVTAFSHDAGNAFDFTDYTPTDRILRSDINGDVVAEYGSEWCAACHDERHSDPEITPAVKNHPVALDSVWVYRTVVSTITNTDSWHIEAPPGGSGVATGLAQTNSGYVMAPVTAGTGDGFIPLANRKAPICQQCHEDARNVKQIFQGDYTHLGVTDPGDPAYEPWLAPINPEFLNFPHQTTNPRMTVESWDDLCTNCHLMDG